MSEPSDIPRSPFSPPTHPPAEQPDWACNTRAIARGRPAHTADAPLNELPCSRRPATPEDPSRTPATATIVERFGGRYDGVGFTPDMGVPPELFDEIVLLLLTL